MAVQNGAENDVKWASKNLADILLNSKCRGGENVLHMAIKGRQKRIVSMLVNNFPVLLFE